MITPLFVILVISVIYVAGDSKIVVLIPTTRLDILEREIIHALHAINNTGRHFKGKNIYLLLAIL